LCLESNDRIKSKYPLPSAFDGRNCLWRTPRSFFAPCESYLSSSVRRWLRVIVSPASHSLLLDEDLNQLGFVCSCPFGDRFGFLGIRSHCSAVTRKYRGRHVVCASSVCALFAISPRDTRWDLYLVLCSVSHSLTGISGCDRARRTGLNRTHIKIYIAFSFLARVTVLNRCAERTILWCNICTNNNLFPDRLYLQGVVYKQYLHTVYIYQSLLVIYLP